MAIGDTDVGEKQEGSNNKEGDGNNYLEFYQEGSKQLIGVYLIN